MQKIEIILLVVTAFCQVCFCVPQTPVDSAAVDLFVDYYMENMVYYFYPIAPFIESELNKVSQLVNNSSTARDEAKAKTLKYVKLHINATLDDLKRREQGCAIHSRLMSAINTIRNLIVDAGDSELLDQFNEHADAIEEKIDWQYYDSNRAKVTNEIQVACRDNGFEKEYSNKLAAKLC